MNRGREESVGKNDVSIVCARKYEMVGRPTAFVRSHTIGGENKRTKNTTMPLAIKTIEVQVIGDQ